MLTFYCKMCIITKVFYVAVYSVKCFDQTLFICLFVCPQHKIKAKFTPASLTTPASAHHQVLIHLQHRKTSEVLVKMGPRSTLWSTLPLPLVTQLLYIQVMEGKALLFCLEVLNQGSWACLSSLKTFHLSPRNLITWLVRSGQTSNQMKHLQGTPLFATYIYYDQDDWESSPAYFQSTVIFLLSKPFLPSCTLKHTLFAFCCTV